MEGGFHKNIDNLCELILEEGFCLFEKLLRNEYFYLAESIHGKSIDLPNGLIFESDRNVV